MKPAVIVPNQLPAFFTDDPMVPDVPTNHRGTILDPTWTTQIGAGFYDQSQRMYQAARVHWTGDPADTTIYLVSAEFYKISYRADFVEVFEPDGACWRISMNRLIDHGFGIEDRGIRYFGCAVEHWTHLVG